MRVREQEKGIQKQKRKKEIKWRMKFERKNIVNKCEGETTTKKRRARRVPATESLRLLTSHSLFPPILMIKKERGGEGGEYTKRS